ncbi:MAG TPA: tRNA lysidine(34) synthetase TilS [Acidobacteriota bacterium]|nr:tRNA lysidine(34) synthetase TilS [Acidobacteriota bacterium]
MLIDARPPKLYPLDFQVRKTIEEHSMIIPGDHVLVAVSGGVDSTALLFCLNKLSPLFGITLTTAHLNHRLRGKDAEDDELFVRQMSETMGLRFFSETIDVKRQAEKTGQNLEECARRRRYDFLQRTALRVGADKIAVGHNLNDQAETAIFRFLRGSGLEGLSSIHPVIDGLVIRPLLDCTRETIQDYLNRQRIPCREDFSNRELHYARNRIRHELVPYLQKHFNPRLIRVIAGEASLARETWDLIESLAVDAYKGARSGGDNGISISIKRLWELHPALRKQVLRLGLKECMGSLRGIGAVHLDNILSLCKTPSGGRQLPLPRGGLVVRQFDELWLLKQPPTEKSSFSHTLLIPGRCDVPEAGAEFHCTIIDTPDSAEMRKNVRGRAFLERAALPESLTVRSKLSGDRYGGPGRRKVKKILMNARVRRLERSCIPMLADGAAVIWIPGFRPARDYEAKSSSSTCVLVEMTGNIWK